jgi:hypothetical protein
MQRISPPKVLSGPGHRAFALTMLAFILCALNWTSAPAPVRIAGEAAFSNHKAGVATIPRQGSVARVSAVSNGEHAKSAAPGSLFGLVTNVPIAFYASGLAERPAPLTPAYIRLRVAHQARGPPAIS